MTHFFEQQGTQKFICGYLLPLCKIEYSQLKVEDYAWRILKDKPREVADDNYLNKIYQTINTRDMDGSIKQNIRVLQISDWHVDLDYKVNSIRENCKHSLCCHEVN